MLLFKRIILGFCICFLSVLPPGCSQNTASGKPAGKNANTADGKDDSAKQEFETVKVDELLRHPGKYQGKPIRVDGIVAKVDSKLVFRLGCEDACLSMPVESEAVKPKQKVVIQGKVTKQKSGKFIFRAGKVSTD